MLVKKNTAILGPNKEKQTFHNRREEDQRYRAQVELTLNNFLKNDNLLLEGMF